MRRKPGFQKPSSVLQNNYLGCRDLFKQERLTLLPNLKRNPKLQAAHQARLVSIAQSKLIT